MMNKRRAAERATMLARLAFLDAEELSLKPQPKPYEPYGCQQYDADRLCRFDRRAIDHNCTGCPRTTDRAYLERMGLWIEGVAF